VRIEIFEEKDIPDSCSHVPGAFEVSEGSPRSFAVDPRTETLSANFMGIHLSNFRRPSDRGKGDELVTEMKYAFVFYTSVTLFGLVFDLRVSRTGVLHTFLIVAAML